ncbi:2-phospho-L-lactate transferase CofD family protein [Streptomyces sp. NPDC057702]|uniref:2-phospho-L-lactate transferase CofD family protein n=1 Tax=unclassified Streptomyces TaxID=2593676 RepID=UPI0036A19616
MAVRTAVFAGGTGTKSIAHHLLHSGGQTTFLVNAFDDGYSTGAIRRALGILGPSDMGKVVSTLVAESLPAVARWLSLRVPAGVTPRSLAEWTRGGLDLGSVPSQVSKQLDMYVESFAALPPVADGTLPLADTAVRNAVLVGARTYHGGRFQAALDALHSLLDLPARVVTVTEEPLHLTSVLTDGTVLFHEWQVCERGSRQPVAQVCFLTGSDRAELEPLSGGDPELSREVLSRSQRPTTTAAATRAIAQAERVIWAPGTLFSSLVPTAAIVGPLLEANERARRVIVANLRQEQEATTVHGSALALARAQRQWAADPTDAPAPIADTVICDVQQRRSGGYAWGDLIPADHERLASQYRVRYAKLEERPGVHDGAALAEEVARALAG